MLQALSLIRNGLMSQQMYYFRATKDLEMKWCLEYSEIKISLKCVGKIYKNVTLTAYYPDYTDQDHEHGYQDKKGQKLRTLQDYVDNRSEFVTLAMDEKLGIAYATKVCIPELNEHFGHRIMLEVRDSSFDLANNGYARADICVRTEIDSYDKSVNGIVTLVFV